ncbi:uncharacterized protein related to plant photosystem II stability/assembly factor [Hahella chejuensis KCTC 2396]|uniref:Uncharacterized protein related to plant photosystem II stability/assembly factor n=1 Tax=Hahella chejuensis (strain KCTC 2396) TaxID=349521 RepID=Q2SDI8_HAHCH|nr:YCF48-related protein [Hahella chejuensis]ABC31286.1 uncharacterized protein related to plant photosystem II stability/assembly factor [Hahella chejuensis KCTC 2396]
MKLTTVLRKMTFACALCASLNSPWALAGDVLSTPAMKTELAPSTLLVDVAKAGDRLVAVGQRGHIIYSDDQGGSWTQSNSPVSTLLTSLYFVDAKQGWAVGHGAVVLHTEDGGVNWSKQFDGFAANEMVIAQAQKRVANLKEQLETAPEEEASDLEYQLEDANFALEDAMADAEVGPGKPLLDVWFKNAQEGFVVGAYGFFFHTEDGGVSWTNWAPRLENTERFHLNAIAQITGGAMFIVGEAGYVFRSTDFGATWETLESPYDGSLFGVSGNGNVNEVFVFGLRGHLFYSQDSGSTWERVGVDVEESLIGAAVGENGRMTVVGNSGVMLLSQNFGEDFKVHPQPDRQGLLGAAFLSSDQLLLVGEGGVNVLKSISKLN